MVVRLYIDGKEGIRLWGVKVQSMNRTEIHQVFGYFISLENEDIDNNDFSGLELHEQQLKAFTRLCKFIL